MKVNKETKLFRERYPTAADYLKRVLKPSVYAKEWVLFEGTNPLRNEESLDWHGVHFEKGYVYHVTPELFEHVKIMRGFKTVKGVEPVLKGLPGQVIKEESLADKETGVINLSTLPEVEPRKRGRPPKVKPSGMDI
jgi:hypothetical protein